MANCANREKEAALSHERLCSLLSYDAETGIFIRKRFRGVGTPAGSIMKHGYRAVKVHYNRFLAGRLAWFYVYGEWPENEIDHINRVRDDNRIANLRPVTRKQNCWNLSPTIGNEVGAENIDLHRSQSGTYCFRVRLCRNGRTFFQKKCRSLGAAITARDAALRSFSIAHYPELNMGGLS